MSEQYSSEGLSFYRQTAVKVNRTEKRKRASGISLAISRLALAILYGTTVIGEMGKEGKENASR